jgi:amidase
MRPTLTLAAITAVFIVATTRPTPSQGFDTPRTFRLVEATIPELAAALETHQINSKQLVKLYLDRIAAYEGTLNAMITVNPNAIAIAHQRDVERDHGDIRGPLHGIPVVLKDNVHTLDMITTGGALAFADLHVPYESTLSQKLRDAGAIILGKTVLTELANWVAEGMPGNYSAVGGYGMNPFDPRPDPRPGLDALGRPFNDGRPVMATGGSSSGIATSVNFAAGNIGTETSGSILSPSNQTMLAGIKPTVGLISRYGVIPIVADQDTAGPMARDVASAAIVLGVVQGYDPNDPATAACLTPGNCLDDYTPYLQADGLAGARIGVPQIGYYNSLTAAQKAVVDAAIAVIQAQGGTVVMTDIPSRADGTLAAWGICAGAADSKANDDTNCSVVLKYGFKRDFNRWLDSLGDASDIDTLAELTRLRAEGYEISGSYDGADVAHLIHACATWLDWPRLLERFGPHWRVLLSHLVLFGFIYQSDRSLVPAPVMESLLDQLQTEKDEPLSRNRVCRGTLLSRSLTPASQRSHLIATEFVWYID